MTLATRIVVMHEGAIEQIGTPAEVYERPRTLRVASFVGSPSINRIAGQHDGGQFRAAALQLPGPPSASAGPLTLGVRPEDVTLGAGQPFEGRVELIEPLGGQHLVWLRCGEPGLVCRATRPAPRWPAATRFSSVSTRAACIGSTPKVSA